MRLRITGRALGQFTLLLVLGLHTSPFTDTCTAEVALEQSNVSPSQDANIRLNFPANVELRVLLDFVSQRLGINLLYDEQVLNKKVTLKTPEEIPESSLLGLLESVLRAKGLALVDDDQPGFKRVVPANNLVAVARPAVGGDVSRPTEAVTQLFRLQHADTRQIEALVKSFLSQPGGNILLIPDQSIVIVTDYAGVLVRISELIRMADRPRSEAAIQFVTIHQMPAAQLAANVKQLMSAKQRIEALGRSSNQDTQLEIAHDERTNQLILIGTPALVAQANQLAASLDVTLDLQTKVYQFKAASPERIDRLTRELIGPLAAARLYRAVVDRDANMLVVSATPAIHGQIDALREDLDRSVALEQSPIRFYKLANSTAGEVLKTIRAIEGGVDFSTMSAMDTDPASDDATHNNTSSLVGIHREATQTTAPPDAPRSPAESGASSSAGKSVRSDDGTGQLRPIPNAVRSERVTVTADSNTNTIIVVAAPAVQRMYEKLISMLDVRRPQVMMEATIIALDTSNGFSFGVEIGTHSSDSRYINFSSFGLSDVDAGTGELTLIPGMGLNSVLVPSPDVQIILRALASSGRAKVLSSPKLLVNDNATGLLSSVNEAPFTSVNASDTVATTSFAGFVSAGTTITVTPHISEDDHLQLKYTVDLNSFTGEGSAGIPPPRQTNTVQSEITIPDGQTIVIGGLNRVDFSETIKRVPILGEIPLIEYIFSSRDINRTETTLFVFIRPTVLRNDRFEDLKYLTSLDLQRSEQNADFPTARPLLMR